LSAGEERVQSLFIDHLLLKHYSDGGFASDNATRQIQTRFEAFAVYSGFDFIPKQEGTL